MKVLVVFAHDKPDSLIHSLATIVARTVEESNYSLELLDLYQYAEHIPFYYHDRAQLESFPFFQKTREQIMAADRLALIFPVYWYSTPGILKCWIDLITNYAWKYEGKLYAKPLHHIHRLLTISTTMSPWWYNFIIRHPAQQQVRRTFRWMGVKNFISHEIGGAHSIKIEDFKNIENKVMQLTRNFLD